MIYLIIHMCKVKTPNRSYQYCFQSFKSHKLTVSIKSIKSPRRATFTKGQTWPPPISEHLGSDASRSCSETRVTSYEGQLGLQSRDFGGSSAQYVLLCSTSVVSHDAFLASVAIPILYSSKEDIRIFSSFSKFSDLRGSASLQSEQVSLTPSFPFLSLSSGPVQLSFRLTSSLTLY